jgi:hypothetical protein
MPDLHDSPATSSESVPLRLDDLIGAITATRSEPLEQLTEAMLAADHLGDLADHLIGHFVDQARRSGASWTSIGESMGVTKQAARKRFVPKDADLGDLGGGSERFSRFTLRARHVVSTAHEEAHDARSAEVTVPHLVLGLLAEPHGLATTFIEEQGVALEDVRSAAVAALPDPTASKVSGHVPFGVDARKVFELAFREALRRQHNYIGTEHLLLAILQLEDGEGTLSELGVTKERVDEQLREALAKIIDERTRAKTEAADPRTAGSTGTAKTGAPRGRATGTSKGRAASKPKPGAKRSSSSKRSPEMKSHKN